MNNHSTSRVNTAIACAYDDGRAAHSGLLVRQEYFESHVTWVIKKNLGSDASSSAATDFVRTLHTKDLYLALACAQKADKAWERFSALYRKYINDLAGFASLTNGAELADSVLADLFLPDHSGQSRIASYQGRSSLATWLRAIICHRAINERERRSNKAEDLEAIQEIADETALARMNALLRSRRYGPVIRESLRYSCQRLSDRERLILLLRYKDGLQLGQIAGLFGVHQSTITRQIDGACKKLREAVVTNLLTEHKLDRAEIDECREDILENPGYSIISLIQPRPLLR